MTFDDVAFAPALEQAELVRSRAVSPVELVTGYLERIERFDPDLNAFVTVCGDEALADARRAEQATGELPPFYGVPLPVKDLTETKGVRTTFSSRAYAEHVPAHDMAVVRRFREAGFILLGKTNTPEFGLSPVTESELNGPCRNPWNLERTPGGSSGGAAAAVAAGLAPVGHGSDGGGSIRIPASCCGLFGIKAARGRISNAPYADGSMALGISGPLTRTVSDAAALLDVLAGYEPGDAQWAPPPARPFARETGEDPPRLRIALVTAPPGDVPVDDACRDAAVDAARLLEELGHVVEETPPAWRTDDFMRLFLLVWQVSPTLYPQATPELIEPLTRAFWTRAQETSSVEYARTVARLQILARSVVSFVLRYDVVLTPTLALPPVPIGWIRGDDPADVWSQFDRMARFTPFTAIVNVTGLPAVSLPLSQADEGLPVGVHLIGRPADEATLLRVSAQVERARPWAQLRPPAPFGATLTPARPTP
jgi:amidase